MSRTATLLLPTGATSTTAVGAFVAGLRARGTRIAGVTTGAIDAQGAPIGERDSPAGLALVDLATGRRAMLARVDVHDPIVIDMATAAIEAALADLPQILVLDLLGLGDGLGARLALALKPLLAGETPLVAVVRPDAVSRWEAIVAAAGRDDVALLRADPAALWRWWAQVPLSPTARAPVLDLVGATPAVAVAEVVVGINWTLVTSADGGCGLAHTPSKGTPGCEAIPAGRSLRGARLDDLARGALSWNPLDAAIGWAAINAGVVPPEAALGTAGGLDTVGGLGALARVASRRSGPPVVIGRFPGIDTHLPGALVLERVPGPGDLPDAAAEIILPTAGRVAITASTLVSGGLGRYLASIPPGVPVALVGPGTPLSPWLFDYGVTHLAGFVVDDRAGLARAVAAGADRRGLAPFGRQVLLTA